MGSMSASVNQPAKPRNRLFRILVILLAVGVLLVGGGVFLRFYYLRLPAAGQGPAGPTVAREPFSEVWSQRRVLVVGLGDSITWGMGAPEGHGCLARLSANPPDEFPDMKGLCLSAVLPNLETRNLAVVGSTSRHHMETQIPQLAVQSPDVLGVVVMSSGGNDLIRSYGHSPPRECAMYGATLEQAAPWVQAYRERLDAMLSRIEACFPGGCYIFLETIYDPTDGGGPGAIPLVAPRWPDALALLSQYNEVIAQCAAKRPSTHLVDLHAAFMGHGFRCDHFWTSCYRPEDPHFWYFQNIEDPNDRGHDAIRRLLLIEIARAFGKLN